MRRITFPLVLVTVLLTLVTAASAEVAAAGARAEPAGAGDARLHVESRLFADVEGARSGVASGATAVTITNEDQAALTYDFFVTVTADSGTSLADAMHVTVRDASDGRIAYEGALTGLSISSALPLQPTESATYIVATSVPSTATEFDSGTAFAFQFDVRGYSAE